MKRLALVTVLFVSGLIAGAVLAQEKRIFVGVRGARCGDWVDHRMKSMSNKTREAEMFETVVTWWTVGFMDGGTKALGIDKPSESAATLTSRLSDYCMGHRDETLGDAAASVLTAIVAASQARPK